MEFPHRLTRLLKPIRTFFAPSSAHLQGASLGIGALGVSVALLYFYFSIISNFAWQKVPAYLGWLILPALLGLLLLGLALLAARIQPRLRLFAALVLPMMTMAVLPGPSMVGYVGGSLAVLSFALIGAGIAGLLGRKFKPREQVGTLLSLGAGLLGIVVGLYAIFSEKEPANPALEDYVLADRTLPLPNPGLPGDYQVSTLTYGSGEDLRRPEFAEDVTLISRRVDGSKLIDNWEGVTGWLRTSYWGFDSTELPLQARVWYPEGEGPFPVVLVVHGNHGMEDFSDPGYDYLGELFASRGIILASVDENYINSSFSSRIIPTTERPGLREENDARGWLLLEHLALFRDWNSEPGHFFEGKIDLDRLALIGHSRGGEAVGIAAAFNSLSRYPDDASVEFDFNFNLRGVIAIAPVYGQYEPRERPTPITDVNYFTIHGDMDGDVQSFEGAAQYSRVSFSGSQYNFRSSLYVVGANHGQFNTTWENLDTGPFSAWALDLGRIMPPEAQRDVARVYFSAFMEVVLWDRKQYLPLFKDARYGKDWLPNTFFINDFSDSEEKVIVDFENDLELTTLDDGGSVSTTNLTRWYERGNEIKYDEFDTYSVVVAWDADVEFESNESPSISFDLSQSVAADSLILSLSAIDTPTKPTGWEEDSNNEAPDNEDSTETASSTANSDADSDISKTLNWTIELSDASGNLAQLALDYDSPLYPLIKAIPRRAGFLDSSEPTEILFRRFELPLDAFASDSSGFDSRSLSRISFVFDESPKGAIILDQISVAPALR